MIKYVKVSSRTHSHLVKLGKNLKKISGEFHSFDATIEQLLRDSSLKYKEIMSLMESLE